MFGDKSRWLSKGFVGGLLSTICSLLALVGIVVSPEEQEIIVSAVLIVTAAVSGIVSAYGRLTATRTLK